ncbi:MAG TPA: hypothetical protein VIK61_14045 [Acidimicrobiia bacterium]
MSIRRSAALAVAVTLLASACHGNDTRSQTKPTSAKTPVTTGGGGVSTTTTTAPISPAIVLSAQASRLDAYATTRPLVTQTVVPSPAADRNGVDVSGQICFDPTTPNRFVAVDRTAAADGQVGWGVFELSGRAIGKLSAKEVARLVPTFQPSPDGATPFGCSFLADGRLLTTDLGNQRAGSPNGQLIEWFPPFEADSVASCKVAVALAAPEGVLVDTDRVLVAESRGASVGSFLVSALPTSSGATGGCTLHDATGAALAGGVVHTPWLQAPAAQVLSSPAALAVAPNGDFFVSNPTTGVIAEVTPDGRFVRRVLAPPSGEVLGHRPFSTGTPVGLAVDPSGTLYYADPGLIVHNATTVAGLRTGTVRRITFVQGVPRPPEVIDTGLQAPYGIGIWLPGA